MSKDDIILVDIEQPNGDVVFDLQYSRTIGTAFLNRLNLKTVDVRDKHALSSNMNDETKAGRSIKTNISIQRIFLAIDIAFPIWTSMKMPCFSCPCTESGLCTLSNQCEKRYFILFQSDKVVPLTMMIIVFLRIFLVVGDSSKRDSGIHCYPTVSWSPLQVSVKQ